MSLLVQIGMLARRARQCGLMIGMATNAGHASLQRPSCLFVVPSITGNADQQHHFSNIGIDLPAVTQRQFLHPATAEYPDQLILSSPILSAMCRGHTQQHGIQSLAADQTSKNKAVADREAPLNGQCPTRMHANLWAKH